MEPEARGVQRAESIWQNRKTEDENTTGRYGD